MPGKHSPDHNAPASSLTVPAMVAGWFLSRGFTPYTPTSICPMEHKNAIHHENATCRHSSGRPAAVLAYKFAAFVVDEQHGQLLNGSPGLSARTHLLQPSFSSALSMARGAPHLPRRWIFEQSHFSMHGTLFTSGGMRTVHKLSRFEMLPPLARKPMIMSFDVG
ncbi:hypothetical protein TNCV_2897961 [Trichonephila clavipes]|nr:hypothetical protein TNCV_2897961 [Trichonephila clavipes]